LYADNAQLSETFRFSIQWSRDLVLRHIAAQAETAEFLEGFAMDPDLLNIEIPLE
jgi:hypothetical protein